MRTVETGKATLAWSADGTTLTKSLKPAIDADEVSLLGTLARAARNELRVNQMFERQPPPVEFPRLVASARRPLSMTFEVIDGEPLGPKYPNDLTADDVDDLVSLVDELGRFRPRRQWLRRFDIERRIRRHEREGLLAHTEAVDLRAFAAHVAPRWRFAHGDVTARNVLRRNGDGVLVLIDWEWAGLYPAGYDRAFLWFSLLDLPDGRARVQHTVRPHEEGSFLLSAVMIQLLHLHLWVGRPDNEFVANHRRTLDELLARIGSPSDVTRSLGG